MYLAFARRHHRFLTFGFLLSFGSSFGQTFFVGLFGADIRAEFALSHGDFGAVYSAATLLSALILVRLGARIDDMDLRRYAVLVCAGLAAACFLVGLAPSVAVLALGLLALRLTGQGLMGHTSVTSMARYFDAGRGKAMSIAALGFPVGEGILPAGAVILVAALGWRGVWMATGAAVALLLIPAVLWAIAGHAERHRRLVDAAEAGGGAADPARQWTRRQVLRDPRFILAMPAIVTSPLVLTGFFFHQGVVAADKGWTLAWIATCFTAYALAKIAGSLLTGPLVDRFGATRLLPYSMPPLGLGLLAVALFDHRAAAMVYMLAAGLNVGAGAATVGAMWAEIYGVRHIGAIRAATSAIMVFATALAPVSMGWLIDQGVAVETIAGACAAWVAVATAILALVYRGASRSGPRGQSRVAKSSREAI